MITILTALKPFVGQAHVHQTNALSSWKALANDVEILVFNKPETVASFVEPFGARVVPGIPTGEDGRARVDAIFEFGRLHAKYDRQVYVNGDILLMGDFVEAFQAIQFQHFLMIGQRTDVDVREALSFQSESAQRAVGGNLSRSGKLCSIWALDYFAYRRGSLPDLPRLYLGAVGWDNLMVYFCRRAGVPVIDATADVKAFHQNHSYFQASDCPSAHANRAQAPEPACFFVVTDASHWLDSGRIRKALISPRYASRMILNYPVLHGWPRCLRKLFQLAATFVRLLGRSPEYDYAVPRT